MIAELAATQHGVVSLLQLEHLGLSARAVHKRVAAGRLHRIHGGVYAVGHAGLSTEGRRMAAVLACGPGAVLSHASAATMWGFVNGDGAKWHVTAPGRSGGRQGPKLVLVHHPRRLDPADVTTLRGVPITTVARTLIDYADGVGRDRVEAALHEAEVQRLLDVDALHDAIARTPGRRGRRRLLGGLARHTAAAPTKTELERRFRTLCRDHDLPAAKTNTYLDIGEPALAEIDVLFEDARLIVELDGAAVHHTRRAFEDDRRRDAALAARGYLVVRVTWHRLREQPAAVASDLRQTLRARMTQFQDTSSRSPGTFITGRAHAQ